MKPAAKVYTGLVMLFLFAPKATPVSALTPAVSALGDRIGTYYIFGE